MLASSRPVAPREDVWLPALLDGVPVGLLPVLEPDGLEPESPESRLLPALPGLLDCELLPFEDWLLPAVIPVPAEVLLVPVLRLLEELLPAPARLLPLREELVEPVERVPALALGDLFEVSSAELLLLSWSESDCPHFMIDCEPLLFRRDQRNAPAAATAVTAAAAATGRDFALSMTVDIPPER